MAKTIVRLQNVQKTYQMGATQVHALRGINLEIPEGEFLAIMGASGSGKSTLLNTFGCLDKPTNGQYILDDRRVDQMNEDELAAIRRTKLGFVFQSFNLLHRSTAVENVELPMVYMGISRRERIRRAEAALDTVGLSDRMDHMPCQMSGGQQQRVALARALVTRPKLLLADEPTGNLDSRTAVEMLELLTRLQREEHLTMTLVTHDPSIAAFAHRVIILHDGRIVYNRLTPAWGGPPIPQFHTVGGSVVEADEPFEPEEVEVEADIDAEVDAEAEADERVERIAAARRSEKVPEKVLWNL